MIIVFNEEMVVFVGERRESIVDYHIRDYYFVRKLEMCSKVMK